ncbi:MAG TPA: PilT/PilU family type 4a pilus ATPase [Minicystis sp.]|nr:PilT/PilU family type 4a pilus ATPase [Minicystis sp.]
MTTPYASEAFLHQLLGKALAANASDIHLKCGQPPGARVRGDMVYFRVDKIRPEDTEAVARLLLANRQPPPDIARLFEFDTSYEVPGVGRFRVNIYRQRGSLAVVMRSIPLEIPTFEELGVPVAATTMAENDRGLVLVVGAAGNGKSSTLAAMVGHINSNFPKHVVTIEDPIEFLHRDDRASVSQREVGLDTASFNEGLRAALRQDPDVILVGEIRDSDTMEIALQAAETGHLVFSTLHTPDVGRTIHRLLALAKNPADVRERFAEVLQGIVAQRLLPRKDDAGRVLAAEVLVATGTVRESLKRPETNPPLKELMEKGVTPYGMQTFEMHLRQLVAQGLVTKDVARAAATF